MKHTVTYNHQSQFIEMFGSPDTPIAKGHDLFTFASGKSMVKSELSNEYPYDCYGGNGITGKARDFLVANTTIVIGRVGEYCGCVHKTTEKSWITDNAIYVKSHSNRLLLDFAFHAFIIADFHKFATESGQPKITQEPLLSYEFPVPSIKEQEVFINIVRQADKSKFDGFKSQFIEMFDSVESFSALENIVSDTFPGEWGNEPTSSNAIKVIRTTNFTNEGRLDLSEVVTREIDSKKVSRKKLNKGDTILERSGGTKDNPVGRVVFFDEGGDYLFNNFTQVLRPKENVNPVYLFYSLYNSYNLNKAAMRAMASQTTGIQNLSMSDYMAKQIKLPSKKLQDKFESIYRQADKSKYYVQK